MMKNFLFLALAFSLALPAPKVEASTSNDIEQIIIKLFAGSDTRGRTLRSHFKASQPSWKKIYRDIIKKTDASTNRDNSSAGYQEEFNRVVNGISTTATETELLVNGPASFKLREELIMNAQKSIHMMVWAVYDDLTGKVNTEWLLEALKNRPELDIRIMVDGNTAKFPDHQKELNRLARESKGKIQVMRWQSHRYRGNGNHRKILVIDEQDVIMGGINIGDWYSHMNPEVKGWRDTDLHMQGQVARTAGELFATIWNEQLKERKKLKLTPVTLSSESSKSLGEVPVTIVDHHPGSKSRKGDWNILMAYAKLIGDAKESIDIENAYFIFTPIIHKAITEALERGVKIRLLTNSGQSVDEPIVTAPILTSAREAKRRGADVYLRLGTTLHSKFMIVDGRIAVIGSDNLHPRSQRFEGEVFVVVFDKAVADEFTAQFDKDIYRGSAVRVEQASDIVVKENVFSRLANLLFWSHL